MKKLKPKEKQLLSEDQAAAMSEEHRSPRQQIPWQVGRKTKHTSYVGLTS